MDKLTITVTIADRPYRLTIDRNEEELIRRAAIEVNKTIKNYSESYAYNDKQDLLAMVALEKTSDALAHKKTDTEGDVQIESKLTEINSLLSEYLIEK